MPLIPPEACFVCQTCLGPLAVQESLPEGQSLVQQILEKVALLARESHLHLDRFEPVFTEDWNADKCMYRLQAQGSFQEVSHLCDSLEQTPLFEVEELTLHGNPNENGVGIGVEILLQICAERCAPVAAGSTSDFSS